MSTKMNLNKAVFEMFGVGKDIYDESAAEENTVNTEAETEEVAVSYESSESDKPAVIPATYIAPGVVIEGNISANGDIELAGELKGDLTAGGTAIIRSGVVGNINAVSLDLVDCNIVGDVTSSGDMVITDGSSVLGNIKAKSLTCAGKVIGDIDVSDNLSLDSTACVNGKITTSTVIVARGAVIKGSLDMRSSN